LSCRFGKPIRIALSGAVNGDAEPQNQDSGQPQGPLIGYTSARLAAVEMSARTVKNLLDRAKRNGLLSET
jgi:hypothetical protein